MKEKVLLVVDADENSAELIVLAAVKTGHHVIRAHTSHEAFSIMDRRLRDLDVIVIDVDPGVHGMAVLEAIDFSPDGPPVIVLADPDETYVNGIAAAHGAATCIEKPFSAEELAAVIEEVSEPAFHSAGCTSDAWGHPHRCQNALYPSPWCQHQRQHKPTQRERANL
jgi:DNA-binding response OmpR family regulator